MTVPGPFTKTAGIHMTKPTASEPKKVLARVLMTCTYGQANDVVSLTADEARLAQDAGQVDTDKAAVAYAKSLANSDTA